MWSFKFLLCCVNVFMKICCVTYVTFIDFVGSLGTCIHLLIKAVNCMQTIEGTLSVAALGILHRVLMVYTHHICVTQCRKCSVMLIVTGRMTRYIMTNIGIVHMMPIMCWDHLSKFVYSDTKVKHNMILGDIHSCQVTATTCITMHYYWSIVHNIYRVLIHLTEVVKAGVKMS